MPAGFHAGEFDTILCLNVLEHIADDDQALRTFGELLSDQGRLILWVPAMPQLYGEIDQAIGHHRRYEREALAAKLHAAGFAVEHAFYFNIPGVLGWYLNAVLLKRRSVPGLQARLANLLVPWLTLEEYLRLPIGMSLIAVGRRVASAAGADDAPAERHVAQGQR
jgi:hypothetical protein